MLNVPTKKERKIFISNKYEVDESDSKWTNSSLKMIFLILEEWWGKGLIKKEFHNYTYYKFYDITVIISEDLDIKSGSL